MNSNRRRQRILVVSDRYLPFSEGGAEISLHLVLRDVVRRGFDVSVFSLGGEIGTIQERYHDGIKVYATGFDDSWPYLPSRHKGVVSRLSGFSNRIAEWFETLSYLFMNSDTRVSDRISRLRLRRSLNRVGRPYWLPMFDDERATQIQALQCLDEVVRKVEPDLVHADNLRSVLLVSVLARRFPSLRKTALVRDNRFFCPELHQSMNIDGKVCAECEVQCVRGLPGPLREQVRDRLTKEKALRVDALDKYDEILTTSEFLRVQVQSLLPRRQVWACGNPTEKVDVVKQPLLRSSTSEVVARILIVGMINENKGQLGICDWLPLLLKREDLPGFEIVLAGRGERITQVLRHRLQEQKAESYVKFLGYLGREELFREYTRASVVVCPNVWPEPFGRVPLEAAVFEKPVVAYDVGGIGEHIIDGQTGKLVPAQDSERLADAIAELLLDPATAKAMGKSARDHIMEKYPPFRVSDQLADVWAQMCSPDSHLRMDKLS